MPPSRSHIRELVTAYLARHPGEHRALAPLLAGLDAPSDPTSRATLPWHITCSAVVIDHAGRALHVRHNASGGLLLAPGGHGEPDDMTLMATAVREVHEETGIPPGLLRQSAAFCHEPADIDIHPIDANPAKGEPAHHHYDFRFVFHLVPPSVEAALQTEEVSAAVWLPLDQITSPGLREKLLAADLSAAPEPVNASVIIHDSGGRYLLHLRDQREGIWEPGVFALLGGGRAPGDASLEATLLRELGEEAPGLKVTGLEPYAVEETTSVDGLSVPVQIFTAVWEGHPDTAGLREGVLLHWCTLEMLDRLPQSPGLGDLLRRHAAQHPPASTPPKASRPSADRSPAGTELHVVGVHLYLQDADGRVLLGLRHPDSAYAGHLYHALAGHCEREDAVSCLIREAKEEAGLILDPEGIELVHLVHSQDSPSARPRIQLFFRPWIWSGVPQVLEPDRCVEWRWFDPKDLPDNTVPYTRQAIGAILDGRPYSDMGWTR
ncbi:NUDIX domain-containing protein [Streptomyces sp. NBC_00654]|uniref:NUDIX domain-containing protein n=1 Tax=Streptomyces sp. NBC_00654 TaxID=2975799 RepID=UPI00225BEB1E|nr:NUDIX domain-containing protein [Streptomyces sp. NBC_00654]MCX4970882.1 NUDIX domain-containing protein [Streptomyces sp. NBC_00654]